MLKIKNERGSFLVLGIFFVVIFMMVGGLAVDVSRYLVLNQKLQQVADGGALAGARALNQYTDEDPDRSRAYSAVLSYLEEHFDEDYLDLYEMHSSENVDGIEVKEISGGDDDIDQYRVGVVVYGSFQPYFFPDRYLDTQLFGTYQVAVAETYFDPRRRVEMDPMDCGMVVNGEMELEGNNFNQNIDGQPANLCANGDINAGNSANGVLGDIYTAGNEFTPPGGGYGDVRTGEPEREPPEFIYDEPDHPGYDVVINDTNFSSWDTCKKEDSARELTTRDGDQLGVCVIRDDGQEYEFEDSLDFSEEDLDNGDSIGIYVEGSLNLSQNNTVHGGIYATVDINVEGNNNEFIGNSEKLGGLSLWAENDVEVKMNNVKIEGITGAGDDYEFTGPPWGGGNVSGFRGVLISGDGFYSGDNSVNTRFQYDPELVDYEALDMKDWEEAVHKKIEQPAYTQISARLVN
ncbi:MAG: Tad domain-containing protein [bacterium]